MNSFIFSSNNYVKYIFFELKQSYNDNANFYYYFEISMFHCYNFAII